MSLRVDFVNHEAARHAVMHWHYSRTMPVGKLVKFGVWEDERFVGVVLFGGGATRHLCMRYKLKPTEGCELVRIALREHATPVTRIVAVCMRLLKKHCPGLRLVVSFSDPYRGHHGGIYQGGNWVYAGTSQPDRFYRDADGKLWHPRGVVERPGKLKKGATVISGLTKVKLPGKHRYLYPFDEAMRAQAILLAKKAPRAGTIDSDGPGIHPGQGGATPTPALQK